jgi:LPXTG-motif cell wall-anchored protein
MDHWRHADEQAQSEIRASIVAHAIQYHLLTRFTSLVAVEEVVVNPGGQSNLAPVPTELPAGWQLEKVVGAPATGTADEFLETMGLGLLLSGIALLALFRKPQAGVL